MEAIEAFILLVCKYKKLETWKKETDKIEILNQLSSPKTLYHYYRQIQLDFLLTVQNIDTSMYQLYNAMLMIVWLINQFE